MKAALIHEYFKSISDNAPHCIAVHCAGEELTYEHLNWASDRVAIDLAGGGVDPGSIVGIYLEPSIEYVVSMIGILKAGGIFLPLNMSFPDVRLRAILDLSRAGTIITNGRLKHKLEGRLSAIRHHERKCSIYEFDDGMIRQKPVGSLVEDARAELVSIAAKRHPAGKEHDGCYLLMTSGSTGEPKAILGSHLGLCHFIEWEISEFGLDKGARVSWLSHPTFDVSLRDVFVPLCCGGTLVIPEESVIQSPHALYQWFWDKKISLTHIVPTLFRLFTQAIKGRRADGRVLMDLKFALIAGEPLYGFDVIQWLNVVGDHVKLVNLYGPSETTLAKLFYPIEISKIEPNSIVPLGKPIPGARVFIMKDGKLCDVEEEGEIYIETKYRSKGYFGNADMTKAAFVRNPIDGGSPEPLYRTGDLGMMLRDGNVQFIGRADTQVKLHGMRIELGEIEVSLTQNPLVKMAAVSLGLDENGNQRMIAYAVPKSGAKLNVESLRQYLLERLPDYMTPNIYVILDALPLTPSGKIDRMNLPAPEMTRPQLAQEYAGATNRTEEDLAQIWSCVLEFKQIGIDDNFFDLGGNSILAAKLAEMISEHFNIELPIVKVFEFPKIRLLAEYISRKGFKETTLEDVEKRARKRRFRRMASPKI